MKRNSTDDLHTKEQRIKLLEAINEALKTALKDSRERLESLEAQWGQVQTNMKRINEAEEKCKQLEVELKKSQLISELLLAKLMRTKMGDSVFKFPRVSLKLITISISVAILTSFYMFRKTF